MTANEESLRALREQVARTTVDIIHSVGSRNRLAKEIGRVKEAESIPGLDDRVEGALVATVLKECDSSGVSREAGLKVLNVLLAESKRVQGLDQPVDTDSPSDWFAKALAMERSGRRVIRLDVGEPDFSPPRAVVDAVVSALSTSKTHYTSARGIPELVEALRHYLAHRRAYDAKAEELAVTTGGRFAVYASIASVVKEGESALVVDPSWPAYKQALRHIGAKPIVLHTTLDGGWEPSADAIVDAVRPNTRALILSYPNNPTGKVVSPATFRGLVDVANDLGLTVISDEAYADYAFAPSASVLGSAARRFVMTGTFSKTWSMTGFRVGYAVSNKETIDRMLRLVSLMLTSVPEFVQYGAIKALESGEEAAANSQTMRRRIELVGKELGKDSSLELYKPEGAMYAFPRSKAIGFDSRRFADELLAKKAVSVIPGTAFGEYNQSFRISLCQPESVLSEGLALIREVAA